MPGKKSAKKRSMKARLKQWISRGHAPSLETIARDRRLTIISEQSPVDGKMITEAGHDGRRDAVDPH